MTLPDDLDRRLSAWLDEAAPMRAPDHLLAQVAARADRTRHRPAWATLERWISMEDRARFGAIPRTAIMIAILGLLLVVFAAAALGSGGSPPPRLPPLTGPAGNGLIAYGTDADVWVISADGSNRRRITSDPDIDFPGVWSPDGTWLAYWSLAFDGDPKDSSAVQAALAGPNIALKVVPADGTDPRTLVSGLRWVSDCSTDISWSPDSQRIAYAQAIVEGIKSTPRIDVLTVAGGTPRTLVDGYSPSWSPDGTTVAFANDRYSASGGAWNGISLISADGTDERRLTTTTGSGCAFDEPQWSPNGEQIVFYNNGDGSHDIWVIGADGSGERALTTLGGDEYWPRWSPDGSRIAFDRVVLPEFNAPQFVLTDPDGRTR